MDSSTRFLSWCFAGLLATGNWSFADTHYASITNAAPLPPFTNWATAATSIQEAVDAATNGDVVRVMDGAYDTGGRVGGYEYLTFKLMNFTNRVTIEASVTVESVNGPGSTFIIGKGPNGPGAVRGVWMSPGARLNGFTVTQGHTLNPVPPKGDQRYCGGGVYGGSCSNCWVINNQTACAGGGAAYSTAYNCRLTGNIATNPYPGIGGGGGGYFTDMYNCWVEGNRAAYGGGGGTEDGTLYNCVIKDNSAIGLAGACRSSSLLNGTVVGNSSETSEYGSLYMGGAWNSIIWDNLPADTSGNLGYDPGFVDYAGGDLHLASNSPCIDAGTGLSPLFLIDPDGVPRVLDGDNNGVAREDLGAYEYIHPQADTDRDRFKDADEVVAGTSPTDPLSYFCIMNVSSEDGGIGLSWEGVSGRLYTIRATLDLATGLWSNVEAFTDVAGISGAMGYTNAGAGGSGFFRVGVKRAE